MIAALGDQLVGGDRGELEGLSDRFLEERAVSVVADRTVGERRWSTPEMLEVEQGLVASALERRGEQAGLCSPEAVRQALAEHPTIGEDQAGMVRDLTLSPNGVRAVVGKAGTGKTYAMGVARHAFALDGYRVLGAAPTGIAATSLEAEGFEEVATVDRLLVELDQEAPAGRWNASRAARHDRRQAEGPVLDGRSVLVVDEASMVGSRKLTRLLQHAQQAGAKVVLVGDDRQLGAIDVGGGFRGLRVRLGASVLTENRRQQQAWEREALELVRDGQVDQAVTAYREHERMVPASSKTELTLNLVRDWWQAHQQAETARRAGEPAGEAVILAYRRDEVDRLNTTCQQVMARNGLLGDQALQVGDRQVYVGDRVVLGRNDLRGLGVANGTRGTVTGIDAERRALTLKTEQDRQLSLPASYLDGPVPAGRRVVDLAYATTGHKAQGLTRWRALVRITGQEDANWLYVQLSRAKQDTRLQTIVGPEPHPGTGELDLPDREPADAYAQLAAALARQGGQRLAIDTTHGWTCAPPQLRSCGRSGTGSSRSWTRPRRIGGAWWSARSSGASRPSSSSPQSRPSILGMGAAGSPATTASTTRTRPRGRWPPGRPSGPPRPRSRPAPRSSTTRHGSKTTTRMVTATARSPGNWRCGPASGPRSPSWSSPPT